MPTGAFFNLRSFSEGGGEGWGNVRLSFTSKDETVNETATYETANQNTERTQFVRYATAKLVYSSLFNNSNPGSTLGGGGGGGPGPPPDPDQPVSGFAQRLNGSTNERYGIAKSISVMPGDVINAQVYVKYVDPVSSNWNSALTTLMGQIAASTAGVVVDGSSYTTSTSSFPYAGLLTTTTTGAPRAYLNWLVFDRNFGFITGGFRQMGSGAKETGTDVAHEMLTLPAAITITQPGYVYIYLSNESPTLVDVFFDDFKVTHTKSPVIQAEEYYPFGLQFNSYSRENSVKNKYLYNQGTGEKTFNTERVTDLELNVDQSKYRTYDYATGRWWQVDPKADMFFSMTPYNYSFNDPVRYNDPEGDCPTCPGAFVDLMVAAKLYWDRLSGATQRLASGTSGSIPSGAPVPNDVRQMQKMMGTMNDAKTVAQAVVDGPGRVASFTDANDITVLLQGANLDGTKATTSDYVFAGVGAALPISGSAIKKLAGGGLDVLEGITKKISNIVGDHLTDKDVTGAVRDILGDPVIIGGKQYDHLDEVTTNLGALGTQIEKLNKAISSGDLTGDVLKEAQRIRSTMQKEKDRIQNLLNKAEKAANE